MCLYNPGNVISILELNWSSAFLLNLPNKQSKSWLVLSNLLLRLGTSFWIMYSPEIMELIIQNLEYRAYLDKIYLADHEGRRVNFGRCWYRLPTTIHPLKRTLIGVLRL